MKTLFLGDWKNSTLQEVQQWLSDNTQCFEKLSLKEWESGDQIIFAYKDEEEIYILFYGNGKLWEYWVNEPEELQFMDTAEVLLDFLFWALRNQYMGYSQITKNHTYANDLEQLLKFNFNPEV